MEYIVNGNPRIIVEVGKKSERSILKKESVSAYTKALRKIQTKGGRTWQE